MRAAWYGVLAQAAVGFEPDPPPPPEPVIVYGIVDPDTAGGEAVLLSTTSGWAFTVGGSALRVDRLRLRMPAAATELVALWRSSDSTKLAEVEISTSAADTWAEVELEAPLELGIGAAYVVAHRHPSGSSRNIYRGGSPVFDSALAYVETRFGTGSAYPASVSTAGIRTGADLGFEVLA